MDTLSSEDMRWITSTAASGCARRLPVGEGRHVEIGLRVHRRRLAIERQVQAYLENKTWARSLGRARGMGERGRWLRDVSQERQENFAYVLDHFHWAG